MDAMFFIVLGATLASFLLTLLFGRFVIPMLRALHAGQSIREVGPQWHNSKAGTPTMGGIMFIAAIILCTVGFGWKSMTENHTYTHLYVLALALCYGLVGFADDFVKVKLKRNLGLTAVQKFLLQLVVAAAFLFVLKGSGDLSCDLYIPFWNTYVPVSEPLYFIFAAFVIVGTVNAVNITDGVDGLAAGTCVPVFLCFTAIVFCWGKEYMPQGIFASGMVGALLGFLIYNFNPARVFMGDTGSLFLGGCISGLAFALDVPLLLIPLCIMPIIETLSDIIQVAYFKLSHGKRVFKMAPFHHHLEMGGWTGRKWKEKEIFVLFAGITLVMAVVSLLGVTGRYSF